MAANQSFDVTSGVDMQEVDNAVNNTNKELATRYDLRGVKFSIELKKTEKQILLTGPDAYRLDMIWDVLLGKMNKRGVPIQNLKRGDIEEAGGMSKRQTIELQQGVPMEIAKEIVKFIKEAKLKKVQAQIQGEQVRVQSPSRDDLQECIN
ncbi:MAG: YajQ family cyclic di-GMP-binding protein, partial [Clostridia bacterium]|nr:YajQ family cyclic di-GMP-binding protein [Deltaproteobacteria bacterium]